MNLILRAADRADRETTIADTRLYCNNERRVRFTATMFGQGLLGARKEVVRAAYLTESTETVQWLGISKAAKDLQLVAKTRLEEILTRDEVLVEACPDEIATVPMLQYLSQRLGNPVKHLRNVLSHIDRLRAWIRDKRKSYEDDYVMCGSETIFMMQERWDKIRKDLYDDELAAFNISKVPDVYDSIKGDLLHSKDFFGPFMQDLIPLYVTAQLLADSVVPQEYGLDLEMKNDIARKIINPLAYQIADEIDTCVRDNIAGGGGGGGGGVAEPVPAAASPGADARRGKSHSQQQQQNQQQQQSQHQHHPDDESATPHATLMHASDDSELADDATSPDMGPAKTPCGAQVGTATAPVSLSSSGSSSASSASSAASVSAGASVPASPQVSESAPSPREPASSSGDDCPRAPKLRFYFSSESHLNAMLNIILHKLKDSAPPRPVFSELNYLSHIVIMAWSSSDGKLKFDIACSLGTSRSVDSLMRVDNSHSLPVEPLLHIASGLSAEQVKWILREVPEAKK
jgi:hypothetical protein